MNGSHVSLTALSRWHPAQKRWDSGWLVGVAACGPPYQLGERWLAELLVVGDPLPPRRRRPRFLATPSGLDLRLGWRSLEGLAYPSPRHLEILSRGAILYDPEGILAARLAPLSADLQAQGIHLHRTVPTSRPRLG